jgi:PKHD-type hydroxylase
MYLRIPGLLGGEELDFIDEMMEQETFRDGAETAGTPTKDSKSNLQLDLATHPKRDELLKLINAAVNRSPGFRSAVLPRKMSQPILSKYLPGMHYGWHIDNAVMPGPAGPLRTDVACTVFLDPASHYEGGELVIQGPSGEMRVKLERGDAFVYPASSLHQVAKVSSGERRALVFWVQSMVAESGKREVLYELELAFTHVMRENPKSPSVQHLQKAQANLLRLWAEL